MSFYKTFASQNLNLRTLNTHTSRNGNRMQLQHPNKCLCFNFLFHAITFYFSMSWKTSSDWWCMWSSALRIHLTSRCFSFAHHSIQMLASCGKNVPYNYTQSSSITYTAIEVRNLWLSQVYRGEDIKLLSFSTRCTLLECFLICFQRCIVCLSFHSIRQRFLCRTSNW